MMLRQVQVTMESIELDEWRFVFQTGQGFFTLPDTQADVTTLASEADAQAWLGRMAAIPAYFSVELRNLQPTELRPMLIPFATLPKTITDERRNALLTIGATARSNAQPTAISMRFAPKVKHRGRPNI